MREAERTCSILTLYSTSCDLIFSLSRLCAAASSASESSDVTRIAAMHTRSTAPSASSSLTALATVKPALEPSPPSVAATTVVSTHSRTALTEL